ncbi:hypothetical protein NIES2104_39250 [Leptolyngbya sp. NIES-2104]|nr:hypothetical protein NIES2104_39250 [Leptolyngbya sp. NIES-2104]
MEERDRSSSSLIDRLMQQSTAQSPIEASLTRELDIWRPVAQC